MNHFRNLSDADRARVRAALAEAEAKSHARFILSVVPQTDRYALYPIVWGALVAIAAAGAIALFLPDWSLSTAFAVQAGIFVVASLLLELAPLRLLLVPPHIKRSHASHLAHREFAARIASHAGPGILLFVAEGERYAQLLADAKTHALAGEAEWSRIVADFTAGMASGRSADAAVAAVASCAKLLEAHYPKPG